MVLLLNSPLLEKIDRNIFYGDYMNLKCLQYYCKLLLFINIISIFSCNITANHYRKLFDDLESNDPIIRRGAVITFYQIDREYALKNINYLLYKLKDPDLEVRKAATISVGMLFLKKNNGNFDVFSVYNPERMAISSSYVTAVELAIPHLIDNTNDSDFQVRMNAATSLGQIGPPAKNAVRSLMRLLNDKNKFVVYQAIIALGNIGRDAEESIPILKNLLQNKDEEVREYSMESIKLIKNIGH